MKVSLPTTGKTSRRGFTKTIASALVAVPVVSSLSAGAQKLASDEPGTATTSSPDPSVAPQERGSNPPVIIDGGSLTVTAPGTLKRFDDDQDTPKRFAHKFKQRNAGAFGPITGVHIINDYADDVLAEYTLGGGETLQIQIWIAEVKKQTGDDDDDTDGAEYHDISILPNIVIQGGMLEIRADKKISSDRKIFKRQGKNQKRYHRNDWDGGTSPFRVARVMVRVMSGATATLKYDSNAAPNDVEKGFRIYLPVYTAP